MTRPTTSRTHRLRIPHVGRRTTAAVSLGALAATLVATATLTVPTAQAVASRPALAPAGSSWLTVLNDVRRSSGLAPVVEEKAWTAGIAAHLRYLRLTPAGYRTGTFASVHHENPASPYYSAAGAAAGASSDLVLGMTASDRTVLNRWLSGPLHAIGLLRPGLTRVAFYRDPLGGAGIDILRGIAATTRRTPVLFPGAGATTDLTRYSPEVPSPLQSCGGWTRAGLPIIALLPSAPVSGTTATLVRPDGSRTASGPRLCVVTERTFTSTDAVYGATGRAILHQDHVVLVVPSAPLTAGRHTVRISQPGRPVIAWSFIVAGTDRTKPTVTLLAPTVATTVASTVRVRWRGRDNSGRIGSYLVQRSVRAPGHRAGAWTDLGGRRVAASLVAATGPRGTTTCFRVRATDPSGNVSRWSNARCVVRR